MTGKLGVPGRHGFRNPRPLKPLAEQRCPPGQPAKHVVLRAHADVGVIRQARTAVHATLRAWGLDDYLIDAVTITSELVTNAVVHARTPIELRLYRSSGRLGIEVADGDPHPPQLHTPQITEFRRRGIMIVDTLAASWGTHPSADGKTVWAEIDTERATIH